MIIFLDFKKRRVDHWSIVVHVPGKGYLLASNFGVVFKLTS